MKKAMPISKSLMLAALLNSEGVNMRRNLVTKELRKELLRTAPPQVVINSFSFFS